MTLADVTGVASPGCGCCKATALFHRQAYGLSRLEKVLRAVLHRDHGDVWVRKVPDEAGKTATVGTGLAKWPRTDI